MSGERAQGMQGLHPALDGVKRPSGGGRALPEISSRAGAPRPEIVKAVHADYIAAGARVITLNTCSASPKRLARNGPDPAAYVDFALGRVDMGATIIGGCCKTTLAHIAEPARTLLRADHTII